MNKKIQSVRGMNDILPFENGDTGSSKQWQYVETIFSNTLKQYGYHEIRTPLVEKSELFHRGVGEVTDIVEKETYDFKDRNNENLTLRPEGTAGCVRAVIEHNMLRGAKQKLWYSGAMYRHERPQKGRYRQFYQLGVEALGFSDEAIEIETLLMTWRFWQQLGLGKHVILELNNLGSNQSREQYKLKLIEYFESNLEKLDEDSNRRLYKNPLRILDSKNDQMRQLIEHAPKLADHVDDESKERFDALCNELNSQKIPYKVNPYLVRGIDYYSNTVFEWVTDQLGSQGTICAGGRYDGLVKQLGGPETPAFGFALGLERILILLKQLHLFPQLSNQPFIYFIHGNKVAQYKALKLAEVIRNLLPDIPLEVNLSGGSFKSQFKQADKIEATFAIIIGDDELETNSIQLKPLTPKAQTIVANELVKGSSNADEEARKALIQKGQLQLKITGENYLIKVLNKLKQKA
ncbi:histidine--tRNA ligase [Thiotrichales bacterium 19S3-7]|nr:histidine--tRNA ligase [Thiotrichales bacterium 19S3-7]MCF6802359.1 histidine--tRNA ligase [Thiotrichales bacterium 19S3-11]